MIPLLTLVVLRLILALARLDLMQAITLTLCMTQQRVLFWWHVSITTLLGVGTTNLTLGENSFGIEDSTGPVAFNFGSASVTATSIPEPNSLLALALGCLGVMSRRRKNEKVRETI